MQSSHKDASEAIRLQLNKIQEKDQNGNYNRFGAQLFIWFLGSLVESSSDPKLRRSGMNLRRGAEKSFADHAGQKISEKIIKFFKDYDYYV